MGLFSTSNSFLGIDIGASGVKIVELKKEGDEARLFSYGFSEYKQVENKDNKYKNDPAYIAHLLNKVWQKAGMTSKNAVAALPTFSVFSSIISLSNVSKKDLKSAIYWEAKKVIPLPLDEMVLNWREVKEESKDGKDNVKVFLTGAPKTLVSKYIDIFKKAQINLLSLETETFSLVRSLLGNDKSTIMLVEMGAGTTDLAIIDKSIPILSRSIDIGGDTITRAISNNLSIGVERAEQFKYDLGIKSIDSESSVIPKTISESIAPIINEIKYTLNLFQGKNEKQVEKIVFSGGSSMLIDFTSYLSKIIDKQVFIGDPWHRISYPEDLKPTLNEVGPRMSVAIGLALRELE